MKKISTLKLTVLIAIIILPFFGFSQNTEKGNSNFSNDNYRAAWWTIDSLEDERLPRSALEKTETLLTRAKKDENAPQIIKAIIYYNKFQKRLEQESYVNAIYRIEDEINEAKFPVKSILQSIVAEMYAKYLMENLRYIGNRTETIDFQNDDIRTWTAAQLNQRAIELYKASLKHEGTKERKLNDFTAILTDGKWFTQELTPTLYDFLAHRAIDFFSNDQTYLTQPAYKFYIDHPEAFAPAEVFATYNFQTRDTISPKYLVISHLQKLIDFHLNDEQPDALVDSDIKRLKFVYQHSILQDKEERYLKALKDLQKQYGAHHSYVEITYEIAQIYSKSGHEYKPFSNTPNQFDIKKAYDVVKEAIERFPDAYGSSQCQSMMRGIERSYASMEVEKVNPRGKPFLMKLKYKNLDKLYFKIIKCEKEDDEKIDKGDRNGLTKFYSKRKATQILNYNLPNENDFQSISTELKISPLSPGKYIVLACKNKNFDINKNFISYIYTHVSDITYLYRKMPYKGEISYCVVNRVTGEPLKRVKAEFEKLVRDKENRKSYFIPAGTYLSDEKGFFIKPIEDKSEHLKVKFSYKDDVLELGETDRMYRQEKRPYDYKSTMFFTDRSIYRPGQIIYFKGIVMDRNEEQLPIILPNTPVTVTFRDAKRQEIEKLELITNEYGTVSGSFIAPTTGLFGQMRIESSINGHRPVRVEEYKRVKFTAKFDPLAKNYRPGDTVTVTGKAKTYTGSIVNGAKVTYRVTRGLSFPYWNGDLYGWNSNPWERKTVMEIARGQTVTDDSGTYSIQFEAVPDPDIPLDQRPYYYYSINADITDVTGETQTAITRVGVGYVLQADIKISKKNNRDSIKTIGIVTKNYNGEFEPAKGTIKIEQLQLPKQSYISRRWEKPDTQIIPEAKFRRDFPLFPYKNEDDKKNWKVKKTVLRAQFDTDKKKEIEVGETLKKSDTGHYKVTLKTKNKYGEEIEVIKYFILYDLDEKKVHSPTALKWFYQDRKEAKPGETINIHFGSAQPDIYFLYEKEFSDNADITWLKVNKIRREKIEIKEKHRGRIVYKLTFFRNNRLYKHFDVISVPWSNKKLNIEYATFRDKLLPGQDEEWRIKILGSEGEKVAAEMLVSMYDMSLDAFVGHRWNAPAKYPQNRGYTKLSLRNEYDFKILKSRHDYVYKKNKRYWFEEKNDRAYPRIDWFDSGFGSRRIYGNRLYTSYSERYDYMTSSNVQALSMAPPQPSSYSDKEAAPSELDLSNIKVRTNLNETVFFFPELQTDAEGSVIIKFKMNEALTRWKFMGFAHTKDYEYGFTEKEIVTQKELMVMPNPPRFFRESDEIHFTAKVSNLSEKDLNGMAKLELFDALTMQPIDADLGNTNASQNFTAKQGQSAPLSWKLDIPKGLMAVTWRVVAKAGNYSDGEESSLPVLTNRMLVTETMPLPVRGNETKTFTFKAMEKAAASSTLDHHKMTLEFTSNPAWYAVQALPYLMEYPHECTEQIFSRFYANSLASSVANSHPKVQRVFEQWKNTDAMLSNLSKNEELKTALLTETPWVLNAQSEEQQKKRIGLLFDLNKMANERDIVFQKMQERQDDNGSFSWFPDGEDNWYITQHIVSGIGHLDKLGAVQFKEDKKVNRMMTKAVNYIDKRLAEHYNKLKKHLKESKSNLQNNHLDGIAIHYLYTRSFFGEIPIPNDTREAFDYYLSQSEKYWTDKGLYSQGMIALALHRNNKLKTPKKIVKSLKERSLNNEELGMYWTYNRGYYWYQRPTETHALMIEVFHEVAQDEQAVNDLKVWILKHKQTNHWRTTKATTSAVYALLMSGTNWLLEDDPVQVKVGKKKIDQSKLNAEAGTGYFKTSWDGKAVENNMSKVEVTNPNDVVAWGAMYWQYFEDLDKITTFEDTPLTLKKELFREENTDTGPAIRPLAAGAKLTPGDKLKVRIELRVDRDMEYIHMKDMRAAGFEPVNVLSQYKWQGGLGYYESTRDAATHFFMDRLPKGTYVFEYPLRVQHAGDFSNGITTIQCMYAPEFTSHSEGVRVEVRP